MPDKLLPISFLRQKRLANKIGLRCFSLTTGLDPSWVTNAERGYREFPEEYIAKLERVLNLNVEEKQILSEWVPMAPPKEEFVPAFPHKFNDPYFLEF